MPTSKRKSVFEGGEKPALLSRGKTSMNSQTLFVTPAPVHRRSLFGPQVQSYAPACQTNLKPSTPSAVLHHERRTPTKKTQILKPLPGEPGHRFFEHTADEAEAVRIRHIVVDTEQLSKEVYTTILSERAHLADLAPSISICKASRTQNGDLGWWWKEEPHPRGNPDFAVDETLLEFALTSRPNVLHRMETPFGWHVFTVEQVRQTLNATHCRTPLRQNPNRNSRKAPGDDLIKPEPRTYALQTLGCQMNRSDSERMAGQLEHIGFTEVMDPFQASLVILNTCNIREHAESKVYSYMGRHVVRKRKFGRDVTLAVAGCVAQQEGEKMLRRIPELDLVFGPQFANRLDELLDQVKSSGCQISATDPVHIIEDITTPRRESSVTAWVNVIYGCGENCTFCTVGNVVRTVEQSRTLGAIRSEIVDIAKAGIREVVLLGQNIDAYGRDMVPKRTFAELLRHIHDVEGIERIRFTTSHPRYISETLVRTCSELPKIMPFFHIPPQSGNNDILKAMRRGYTVESFIKVVDRIREHIPDAAICGDMIVGFPGESEEQFQNSLDLMDLIKFDVMNTAAYSRRPQTPAAVMEDQIDEEVMHERLLKMNRVVSEHAYERSLRYVGRTEDVLVEHQNPKDATQVVGRTPTNRPVHFQGSIDELKGKIVAVKIVKAFSFSLQGEHVGTPK